MTIHFDRATAHGVTLRQTCLGQMLYLDKSHSEADAQHDPDVGEEPALHAGSTTLKGESFKNEEHSQLNS